jgi:tetratricopeptide (TPR) repeat protein
MASSSEIEKLERRYAENPDGRFFAPLADAYRKAGQVDRALELVRAGIGKHPDYLSAHIVLGRCLLDKGTDPEAAATFQSVLALDGENIIALKSLAEISERAGRVDEARQWLQKLLTVDSMNAEAEADLQRLGGPLAAAAAAPEEAPAEIAPETSFADVAEEMEAAPAAAEVGEAASAVAETTQVVEAVHEPAPTPMVEEPAPVAEAPEPLPPAPPPVSFSEAPTQPMEALALEMPEEPAPVAMHEEPPPVAEKPDIHPLPGETRVSSEALDVLPFDDSLAWGTGERSSRAIRAEDVQAVMHDSEVRSPAIEFMSEMGLPASEEAAAQAPSPAPAPAAPSEDEFSIEPPPDRSLGGLEVAAEPTDVELPANLSGAYSIVDEIPQPPVPSPEPLGGTPAAGDLHLIMPEDVTPPEELARPSSKQVQMVSPPPREEPAARPPLVTETMGDLYLKQGFRTEAADVYRSLLAQRPEDAGLAAKLRAAEGPLPDLRAVSLGAESVGTWLKRVAGARLSAAPSPPPPDVPTLAPEPATPLEAAFSAPEPEGEPAHPAPDAFSLDQIFGAAGEAGSASPATPEKAAPAPVLGASFDEFFGAPAPAPAPAPALPEPAAAPKRPSQLGDEDLSAFSAWLQGLKK